MCAQQHLYMGVRVGISAKHRTGNTPSSGKKSNSFTGHEYSLCKEKIHLYLLLQTLYFLYPDCDVQSRLELYMYEGLPGVLGNKGTKGKYRGEQGNMTPVLGNTGT